MFISAVDDYEDLQRALPLPMSITIGGAPRDPQKYWTHILHASVLRKFFHGTDQLNMKRIYDAMDACIVDLKPRVREHLDAARQICTALNSSSQVGFVGPGGSMRGESAVTLDELYGRHLHGDYDRWQRSLSGGRFFGENAALQWNSSAQRLLRLTRQTLDLGLRDGTFNLDRSAIDCV